MSHYKRIHKNEYVKTLSMTDLINYEVILKKKLEFYQKTFDEAEKAELENQDDYGLLGSIQGEMDYAERCIMRCEKKLKAVAYLMKK